MSTPRRPPAGAPVEGRAQRSAAARGRRRTAQRRGCVLAAAAWAEIIADVVADNHPEETAKAISKQYQDISEDGSIISQAIDLALNAPRDAAPETVETLGKGWNAVEALSIALYACISTKSLDGGLQCALIHSGDSDSTAAIAGNLLGVMYPDEIFCHPLIKGLEGRNIIEDIVFKLAH